MTISRGEACADEPVGAGPGAPQHLGRYQVLRSLARGGMGEVLLARAEGVDRLLAVKCMHPQHAARPQLCRMFLREARVAERLWHPNLVQVFDSGVVDGRRYLAMEFVHGETVHSILRRSAQLRRRTPLGHALEIVFAVCAALHHAHEARLADGSPLLLVHRDVSPQNVMVSYEGEVKLLDFGIARSTLQETATEVGQVKGKAGYMSPEQCLGQRVDRRSDLYSAGILLYELTLGRKLFRAASDYELMRKVVAGEVRPPRELDPGYDERLEAVVLRALERDPALRFQTAREMALALEDVLQARGVVPSADGLRRFMRELFADRVASWERARAAGRTLGDHLAASPEPAPTSATSEPDRQEEVHTPVERRVPERPVPPDFAVAALGPRTPASPSRTPRAVPRPAAAPRTAAPEPPPAPIMAFSDEVCGVRANADPGPRVIVPAAESKRVGQRTASEPGRTPTVARLRAAVARLPTAASLRAIGRSAAARRREIVVAALVALPFLLIAVLLVVYTLRGSPMLPAPFRPEPQGAAEIAP